MSRLLWSLVAAALPATVQADFEFSEPLPVSGETAVGIFPHLEAAGRASLAVSSAGEVAVVWEDNRSGSPQVYAAIKAKAARAFAAPLQLSTGKAAYEPAVVAIGGGRFLALMEQDGAVYGRIFGLGATGPLTKVSRSDGAAQPTMAPVAGHGDGIHAAWVEEDRVLLARLDAEGNQVRARWHRLVDGEAGPQLYPAVAGTADGGAVVAWEDRRHGHTRLYTVRLHLDGSWGEVQGLNETSSGTAPFGRGSGVTRVALDSSRAGDTTAAVWMDKRHFRGGYDIYAALLGENGRFGDNELVQDLFGENQPQWHPDIAVSPEGRVVAAWDDPRDGTPDLWLSWRTGQGEWSSDVTFEAGSGPGAQTHPVIAFGPEGGLHIAWVHRPGNGPVEVRYAQAEWVE